MPHAQNWGTGFESPMASVSPSNPLSKRQITTQLAIFPMLKGGWRVQGSLLSVTGCFVVFVRIPDSILEPPRSRAGAQQESNLPRPACSYGGDLVARRPKDLEVNGYPFGARTTYVPKGRN